MKNRKVNVSRVFALIALGVSIISLLIGCIGMYQVYSMKHKEVFTVQKVTKGTAAYFDGRWNGNMIRIQHATNIESTYIHLSQIYVNTGQRVAAGETIGAVGNTHGVNLGDIGYHLDFRIKENGVNVKDAEKVIEDPQTWKPLADIVFDLVDKRKRLEIPEIADYLKELRNNNKDNN